MSRVLVAAAVGFVCGFCAQASFADEPGLAQEASQRIADLGEQGFFAEDVTVGWPKQLELFVEQSDSPHEIALWFATEHGRIEIKLRDPTGLPLLSWRGIRGERASSRKGSPPANTCSPFSRWTRRTTMRRCTSSLGSRALWPSPATWTGTG